MQKLLVALCIFGLSVVSMTQVVTASSFIEKTVVFNEDSEESSEGGEDEKDPEEDCD